jgi:hypothetical protein
VRRSVHGLLVGLLVFSLSVDAARACGHLRHWHPCSSPGTAAVVVVATVDDWAWCHPVESAWLADCGWCDEAVMTLSSDDSACCAEVLCGASSDVLDATGVVVASPVVPEESEAITSVVVSTPGPTLAPAPHPAAPIAPKPVAAAPALESIEPVSASAPPAMEPKPAPRPAELPVEQPAPPPALRNAFEEADADAAPAADGAVPAVDPAPAPKPVAEPPVQPQAAREPLRRWIDDTAVYAVVGRLVDVQGERVEILKADGRSVTVPLARLSGLDRGYVVGAALRLASARPAGPRPTDTVGR